MKDSGHPAIRRLKHLLVTSHLHELVRIRAISLFLVLDGSLVRPAFSLVGLASLHTLLPIV